MGGAAPRRGPWRRVLLRLGLGFVGGVVVVGAAAGAALARPDAVRANSSFDSVLLGLINGDRAAHGLGALQWSQPLGSLAEAAPYGGCGSPIAGRAEDMVRRNYFSHTILACGNRNVFDMMRAGGVPFSSAAENIGYAYNVSDATAAAHWVNDHFMASPEHEANILNPGFTTVGIGSWWTAPGQTWTGAGGSMTSVVVTAVEFTNGPRFAPVAAPAHHAAAAHAQAMAAPPRRVPAMPLTGAVPLQDDSAPTPVPTLFDVSGAQRVSAMAGSSPSSMSASVGFTCAAAVLALLGWVRRRATSR